ncbi:MAG: TetR/AcrR family transcriptional regulator [Anaerocolumna sp.]
MITILKGENMSQTTRNALATSLKKLLENKPLEKISVRDITEDSEVNRQTFYYHYKDVYDLIEGIFLEEGTKVLGDYKRYDSFQQGFVQIFYYILENQRLVLSAYHSLGRERLERFLYGEVHKLIIRVVSNESNSLDVSDAHKNYVANFYKYAIVGMIFQWIRTDMKEDPKEVVDTISDFISGDIYHSLLKYHDK